MFFLIITLSLNFSTQIFIFPLALGIILLLDTDVFELFLRWKFPVFLGIPILGVPMFVGDQNAKIMGVS
jgi:hypothetical protein